RPMALRSAAVRERACDFACRDSAACDTADEPSRFNAAALARERRGFVRFFACERPARYALCALRRVLSDVVPLRGGGSATPARRAFDSPIAMACFVDRAPCLPERMSSISSRTNSPACVLGDLPCCLSFVARSSVFL